MVSIDITNRGVEDNPWTEEQIEEFLDEYDASDFDRRDRVGELIAVIREEDGEEVRYDI